jgi:hypothetical protein
LYVIGDEDIFFEGDRLDESHIVVAISEPQNRVYIAEVDDVFPRM